MCILVFFFFFQAEDGIRDKLVTGVQTCALPICFLVVHFDEAEDVGLTEAGMHLVDPRDRLQGLDDVLSLSRFDLDQDVGFGCHGFLLGRWAWEGRLWRGPLPRHCWGRS